MKSRRRLGNHEALHHRYSAARIRQSDALGQREGRLTDRQERFAGCGFAPTTLWLRRCQQLGVQAVITDRPAYIVEVLGRTR